MAWTGERGKRLPKDWHRRRAIAKREAAGQCQAVTDGTRCQAPGTDCDHIDRHGGDDVSNLQWLCRPHHNVKTQGESQAAKLSRRRVVGKHPGLL
jgi:5-methylcytosine-specific restriction protein A